MAELPRYRESNLFSPDVPRMDFANLRESAQAASSMAGSLERMSQFAFGEARKEQDKINKLTAIQARTELEAVVQKRFAELSLDVDRGNVTDFNALQTEIQAMSGLADSLKDLDIDQANGLLSSIRSSGRTLLAKGSDKILKREQAAAGVLFDDLSASAERNLADDMLVNSDPNYIYAKISQYRGKGLALADKTSNPIESMQKFDKSLSAAKVNALADYALSGGFAENQSSAVEKLTSGDAGRYSGIWKTMSNAERQNVYDEIKKRNQVKQEAVKSELDSAENRARPLVKILLTSENAADRASALAKIEELPLSPEKLKTYQGYASSNAGYAAEDDPMALMDMTRKAATNNLSESDLIKARKSLTKESFVSLAKSLGNPKDALSSGTKQIDLVVGIQASNLPPELPTPEARSAAINARNAAHIELISYANTPLADGTLPGNVDIAAKSKQIISTLEAKMAPVFDKQAAKELSNAVLAVPTLRGIDLNDQVAVEKAISDYISKDPKNGPTMAAAAQESIKNYRMYSSKAKAKQ